MTPTLFAILPELFILCMASIVLLWVAFFPQAQRTSYFLTQLTLFIAFLICYYQYTVSSTLITFNGHYVIDKLAVISKLFIFIFSMFAFAYAREYIESRHISRNDYYLLGLFSVLGMSVMASAESFLTIFLGLELLSLPLYAMIAIHKASDQATESALKYFVLGSFASGLLLYGISFFYGLTGSIQLKTVASVLQHSHDIVILIALLFVLAGLLFKFGAVPFHMWVPDVYEGAPTPSTLFLASAPKIAAFVITLRVLMEAFPAASDWQSVLIIVSVLSMFLGNLVAIAQTNLKRMFAYSSIAHIGYTLLGIIAGPYSTQGYAAALFYIITYVLVAAGGFAIICIMSKEGIDFDRLEDYRGLNARHPWLAFMMLILLFSMAGIPPTVGFFAKLGLLEALVQAKLLWLAAVSLVFALIGVYYYLRVVMLMYFEEPSEDSKQELTVTPRMTVLISMNGMAALILGLLPSGLIDLCRTIVDL